MNEIRSQSEAMGEKVEAQSVESLNKVSSPALPELEQKAVCQALGFETDSESNKFKGQVDTILKWAKTKTDDHSPEGLKWAIRNLELRLGTPPFGEHRARFLSRYAYLQMESESLRKQMDTLEGKHG